MGDTESAVLFFDDLSSDPASDDTPSDDPASDDPTQGRKGLDVFRMRLKVLLPSEILVDAPALKVTAEAVNGYFTLLPRHIDFVSALAPGILSYETPEGESVYLGLDEGILVKVGSVVRVSARHGVRGPDLGDLRRTVAESFEIVDERERRARSATARMEAGFVRRFMDVQSHGG